MRRVRFTTTRGVSLAGDLHSSSGDVAVVLAHGLGSDRRSRGRFDRIAADLTGLGYAVLAFDFGGCGGSDDEALSVAGEVEDIRSALAFVTSHGYRRHVLYGHSLGSLGCLRAANGTVETMAFSGALTGPMHYHWPDYYAPALLAALERDGTMRIPDVNENARTSLLLSRQTLLDFEQIDQAVLLDAVRCPVLLVHGDSPRDAEELELLAHSRRGLPRLPAGSRLAVVPGSGHGFDGVYHHELRQLVCDWIVEQAPLAA
jgi:putative redox protein